MSRRRYLSQRPASFTLNPGNPWAARLSFAGLGGRNCRGSLCYADSSLRRNDGTLAGYNTSGNYPPQAWSGALGRGCLAFSGGINEVSVPSAAVTAGSKTLTWAGWYKPTSIANYVAYVDFFYTGGQRNISFFPNSGSYIYAGVGNTAGAQISISPSIVANVWQHVCLTADGTTVRLYVNGILAGSSTGAIGSGCALPAINQIGGNPSGGATMYSGSQADQLFWPATCLPASIIPRLADPGNYMLDTGGGNCLILPPRRQSFPAKAGFNPSWAAVNRQIGVV